MPIEPVASKSGKPRGTYAAIINANLAAGEDGIIWRCTHNHLSLRHAEDCNRRALDAFNFLDQNGIWMGTAEGVL